MELFSQLAPPAGLAILKDSDSPQTLNLGVALWTNLAADHSIDNFLEKLAATLKSNGMELNKKDNWYEADMAAWGVAQNHLLFGGGTSTAKAVQNDLGSGSFLDSMTPGLKEIIEGDAIYAFGVDIKQLNPILADIPMANIPPEAKEIMDILDYLAVDVSTYDETISVKVKGVLKAAETDGFANLFKEKVLPEIQAQAKN